MSHRSYQIKAKSSCAYQTSPSAVQTWNESNIPAPHGSMSGSHNIVVERERFTFLLPEFIFSCSLSNSGSRKVKVAVLYGLYLMTAFKKLSDERNVHNLYFFSVSDSVFL